MAKRVQLNFQDPVRAKIAEDGMARPCAMGREWVNEDTLQTLAKRRVQRTDAKGNPLPDEAQKNPVV